ncbi:Gtpase activating protein [Coemansia spiralis]|uniref:Gtpase activating protein n=2 Tax=Coemansia TaxID=4863 RepID=A0A9W8G5R6_9FUNG|nr:Gtpase activating protein [Coemansia umbellata]KAJ2624807.1 Gtpase activating protein [Coemansia sp. RSA 1358]KAJ2674564.1 Gtpase activating protein [Coemansia spiralis]
MVAITDKDQKKLAEKHNKLLAELVKQPDNSTCADCGANGPRWASWNLGVFLCIRCGGAHRRIGTHISKVKSINLDNWTTEQIEHFRRIGNKRANAFFIPHPDRHPPPRTDREIERYVRDKYERRLFVDHRSNIPDPTTEDLYADSSAQPLSPSSTLGAPDEATALTRLREMGFVNVRDNHSALKRFSFNIEAAAAYLRGEPAPAKPKISPSDPRVKQLLNMGFEHVGQNVQALVQCDGDLNQAIELLLSDNPPPRTSATPQPVSKTASIAASKASTTASTNNGNSSSALAPATDLLSDDLFGAGPSKEQQPVSAGATAQNTSANLNDLFGGLSLSSASIAAAPIAASAPSSNTRPSQDLFGDFGDFLSAAPKPSTVSKQQVKPATEFAAAAPSTALPRPTSPPSQGPSKSTFDSDFIMSLYSKPSPQQTTPTSGATAAATATQHAQSPQGSGGAFADLDLLF